MSFKPRVEDIRELKGVRFAGAEGLFESREAEAVDRVDFDPLGETKLVNAEFEFIADLGIEGHKRDAFGGFMPLRVPAVDDVGDHLDNRKRFTRARDGFDDEVAVWVVGPLNTGQLFLGKVG